MPVLPLFDTPADPDAWHRVTAPGGYERWHFDAEDESRGVRVVAEFLEGVAFNTDYLHRYRRYLRRPTRVPPPQAREYPCVQFSVFESGRRLCAEAVHYHPDELTASDARPDVPIGANAFRVEHDGSLRVEVRQPRCSADLVFRPVFRHAPLERILVPGGGHGGEHYWVVAQPLCRVEGSVRVLPHGEGLREIPFTGLGYHDHRFGTRPQGTSFVRRMWGRLLAEDRGIVFHVVTPASSDQPDEVQFLEIDAAGIRPLTVAAGNVDWSRRVRRGVLYPATVALGEHLRLSNPRLLDFNPHHLRLEYDGEGEGAPRTAFCEVVHPPALARPRRSR